MAKKKQESSQEPIISSIPIPPSDSALVIDLPDGQKLLVGKIETGTVIEVATWRGTGRPDSRTNRLMLGMSTDNQQNQPEATSEVKPPSIRSLKFPQNILFILNQLIGKSRIIFRSSLIQIKKVNLSIVKLKKIKFKSIKSSKVNKFERTTDFNASESLKGLKLEEDFDVDFQRILDEVNQKRIKNPAKSLQKGAASSGKSKSNGKKLGGSGKKSVKKSK